MDQNNTFHRDLLRGQEIEKKVLISIQKKYPKAHQIDGYFKEYDIFIPEINKSVEVKSDEQSKYTGNILVEVEFNGKPSALNTSKADYWVFWDGYKFNWFIISRIWDCINDFNLKTRSFVGKGDVHQKKAYLIPKNKLYRYKIDLNTTKSKI